MHDYIARGFNTPPFKSISHARMFYKLRRAVDGWAADQARVFAAHMTSGAV